MTDSLIDKLSDLRRSNENELWRLAVIEAIEIVRQHTAAPDVERVARALCRYHRHSPENVAWPIHVDEAKAAIAAMGEAQDTGNVPHVAHVSPANRAWGPYITPSDVIDLGLIPPKQSSEISLLPCPFCGSEADLVEHAGLTMSKHYTGHVICGNCELVYGNTGWGRSRQEANDKAVEAWNMRPTKPVSVDLEALDMQAYKRGFKDCEKMIIEEPWRFKSAEQPVDISQSQSDYWWALAWAREQGCKGELYYIGGAYPHWQCAIDGKPYNFAAPYDSRPHKRESGDLEELRRFKRNTEAMLHLIGEDVAFMGSNWADDAQAKGYPKECYLGSVGCLMMNDTFYYASADGEDVPYDEWPRLKEIYEQWGQDGLIAWVALRRGHDPQIPQNVTNQFKKAKAALSKIEVQTTEEK